MSRNIQIGAGHYNIAMPGKGAPVLNEGDTYTISDVDFASMQSAGVVGPDAMIVDLGYVDTGGGGGGGGIATESDPIASAAVNTERTRAQGAESSNALAISGEVTRAQAQEALMAHVTALTSETNRALAAEALLARISDLTAETTRATADVDTEESARIADVDSEQSRAQAAEAAEASARAAAIAAIPAGASAYEIWLSAGHTGTEADFLASLVGPQAGQEIASTDIVAATNPVTNNTYYTQGQVVVPAGTPAHEVELINGLLASVITGTQPLATPMRVDAAIFDEANVLVAYNAFTVVQETSATSKPVQDALPVKASLPAATVTKTYTLQVRGYNVNANGASVNILIGGAFPSRKLVARYR